MNILLRLYDFVILLGFLFYLPFYFWRRKINFSALGEKLGFVKKSFSTGCVWFQVVSVGEVNLIGGILKRLQEVVDSPIALSVTTLTGYRVAMEKYSTFADIFFLPLDLSFIVSKTIKRLRPRVFVAVETEVWPNLFYRLHRMNIPIVIINGRISDKAYKRYALIKPLLRKIINIPYRIGVQNNIYHRRFSNLGAREEKIIESGNMKFESISVDERKLADFKKNWLPRMKCGGKDFVFLAASTHEPEESIIVDLYREIEKQFGNIRLVLAPRHPQRARAVSDIVSQKGYEPVKLSNFSRQHLKEKDVLLIDSVGKLLYFYSICDICFVGGSLVDTGGHNILEPVYFLKPTMFGPHMANFVDIESAVMEKNAGIRVSGLEDLKAQTIRLLKDPLYRDSFKRKCAEVFDTHINNVENNLQLILQALSRKPENHVSQ